MHQIQRQIIDVNVLGGGDGFQWQRDLERLATGSLTARLEALFDQYSSDNLVVIDRLTIDLGTLGAHSFEAEFVKAVEKELSHRLPQLVAAPSASEPASAFEAFLYFLSHGTLPWWMEPEVYKDFMKAAETPEGWRAYQPAVAGRLAAVLRTHPAALRRLQEQHSPPFIEQLMLRLPLASTPEVPAQWQLFRRIARSYGLPLASTPAKYFLVELIKNQLAARPVAGLSLAQVLYHTLTQPEVRQVLQPPLSDQQWDSFLEEVRSVAEVPYSEVLSTPAQEEQKVPDVTKETNPLAEAAAETDTYYYVANGGLVLLAPFLTEYLKSCQVATDRSITDPDAAVHLLQYLVTGQVATPEYELPLNKVLCGLPIHAPVAEGTLLTEAQQQETQALLSAVLRYWSVLKNTSPEGLRSSFLQRPAKLSRRPDDWLLQVEQAPYDLLLSDLPWSYSPVALPWMPEPVWVEWT